MRTITTLVFASLLTLSLAGSKVCCGQIIAIGHVSAEVIESVSATSKAITSFEIGTTKANGTATNLTSENINLGAITVNSGKDITCNVVLKPATLSDSLGNDFMLEPTVNNNTLASITQQNGSQTIQLGGKTNMASDQASGLYKGSYTVVFAYN